MILLIKIIKCKIKTSIDTMFSAYNALWGYGNQGSPAVLELLNDPQLELEDLLDEEGLSNDLKTSNTKLFDFLTREDNFSKLLDYALKEPELECFDFNPKKVFKYPFIATEVLISEAPAIISSFFGDVDEPKPSNEEANGENEIKSTQSQKDMRHLESLFKFLEGKNLNLTCTGYFAKIFTALMNKRQTELLDYLFDKRPEILDNMINHCYSKSIMEIVGKLIGIESSAIQGLPEENFTNLRKKMIRNCLAKLGPETDIDEMTNISSVACETFSKFQSMHNSAEIISEMLNQPTMNHFFEILKGNNQSGTTNIGVILANAFAYYILIKAGSLGQGSPSTDENSSQIELPDDIPLIANLINNIKPISEMIINPSLEKINSQYGKEIVAFGGSKLKLFELLIIAAKSNNKSVHQELAQCGVLKNMLELFIKHEWNNFLHNQIEKFITVILEGPSQILKEALVGEAGLPEFIASACQESDYTMTGKHARKIRKGYLGQMIKIANRLNEASDPNIIKHLVQNEKWKTFVEDQLAKTNETNRIHFGGRDPRAPILDETSSADSLERNASAFLQKFSTYFTNSQISKQDGDFAEGEELKPDDENNRENENQENDENPAQDWRVEHIEDNSSKDVIPDSSAPIRGRSSFGFVNRIEAKPFELEEENNDPIWFSDPVQINVNATPGNSIEIQGQPGENNQGSNQEIIVKKEELIDDQKFYENQYWEHTEWHSVDDVLKEFGF